MTLRYNEALRPSQAGGGSRLLIAFAALLLLAVPQIGMAAPHASAAPPVFIAPDRAAAPVLSDIASDPADLSGYLAYWQARAYERSIANFRPTTLNQQAFDVRYYDLDLYPNISTKALTGTVRMIATVTNGPITSVDLDFDNANMFCDVTTSAGTPTTFAQGGGLLTVQLDRAYNTGENVNVVVNYHGSPSGGAFTASFGFTVQGSYTLVASLSEPFDARTWWPCKDDPSDKADSVDVRMTMPAGYITAGNGVRVYSLDNGTTSVTRWHERHPIATYLVSVASYPYTVVTDWYRPAPTDSMPILFHLYPSNVAATAAVHAKVKNMIAAYEAKFGNYPFRDEKYGHAQFQWGGGMEHQTCTSLGSFGEYTVAHELGHQWWGDAVTCADFHHIWVNEGFATFCECIWAESLGGITAFHSRMNGFAYYGSGSIYVPDLSNVNRIFDSNLSYHKAGWVLAMLRHMMGDANFFLGMRTYLAQHYYNSATTENFEATMEQVSGLDLTQFFQQWIYGEYYPQYRINSAYLASGGGGYDVTLQLQQTQTWQLFKLPLDVRIVTGSGTYNFVVQDSTALQLFSFNVPNPPTSVTLDPDQWVLKSVTNVTGVEASVAKRALALGVPSPNPTRGDAVIGFSTPRQGNVDVDVIDASGRRVSRLQHGALAAGEHRVTWSGRDEVGNALKPGVYWVRLATGGEQRSSRIALIN